MKAKGIFISALLLLTLSMLSGCDDSPSSVEMGHLKLYLTDSPAQYDEVNIEIVRVEVHSSGSDSLGGWEIINGDTAIYDLLELRNGASVVLGDQMLPAGKYTQIRLFVGENSNIIVDGITYDLEIPSDAVKLNHNFDIEAGVLYELTLDFDAEKSVVQEGNGQYRLQPVIRVTANAISGSIAGIVLPPSARSVVTAAAGLDTITAYCDTIGGHFLMAIIPAATYSLFINPSDTTHMDTTITNVEVTPLQQTNIGTIQLRTR